ncbi:hypothetical protein LIER_13921 [Lithospermum erythrorhizon]|uniref:Uncharacterized protein n=1 Tax=Lithospermum erythrorhizon TaxID=34254 RepID=A0AAV3PX55_LITER
MSPGQQGAKADHPETKAEQRPSHCRWRSMPPGSRGLRWNQGRVQPPSRPWGQSIRGGVSDGRESRPSRCIERRRKEKLSSWGHACQETGGVETIYGHLHVGSKLGWTRPHQRQHVPHKGVEESTKAVFQSHHKDTPHTRGGGGGGGFARSVAKARRMITSGGMPKRVLREVRASGEEFARSVANPYFSKPRRVARKRSCHDRGWRVVLVFKGTVCIGSVWSSTTIASKEEDNWGEEGDLASLLEVSDIIEDKEEDEEG